VGRGEFHFQGIPLNLKGGSGSPVRALAFVD
jgi:kynurenine formamidase